MGKHHTTDLDLARDELFSHVHRCGVLKAAPEQQEEWMDDTLGYLAERFPGLSPEELGELKSIGMRFCAPPIPHGKQHNALAEDAGTEQVEGTQQTEDESSEENEMVGAA